MTENEAPNESLEKIKPENANRDMNNDKLTSEEKIDESGFDFANKLGWIWAIYYSAYVYNSTMRSLFYILFVSEGTGFRWVIAGAIFQTLIGDLITAGTVSYYSDRMNNQIFGLGYRKFFLALANVLTMAGVIGLTSGLYLSNSHRGIIYVIFGTVHACGQACNENMRNPYLIENTSCQQEFVKMNNYYTFPVGIAAAFLATVLFLFVEPMAAVGIGLASGSVGIYVLYWLSEAPNKHEKQPDLLPAIRITMDNPVGRALLITMALVEVARGFDGLKVQLVFIQINFSLIRRQSDLMYLYVAGFFVTVPVLLAALIKFKKDMENKGDKYDLILWVCKSLMITYSLSFVVACLADYVEEMVWPFLFFGFVCLAYLKMYLSLTMNCMIRDACLLDTVYTGVNRYSLYNMAITRPAAVLVTIVGSLIFSILDSTGYDELEDDTLDDRVGTRLEYTNDTVWYLRMMTLIMPLILFVIAFYIFSSFPLDESRSERLDQIVKVNKNNNENENMERNSLSTVSSSITRPSSSSTLRRTSVSLASVRKQISQQSSFLGIGLSQAEKRLSMQEGGGASINPMNSMNKADSTNLMNEEDPDSGSKNSLLNADNITNMLNLSWSELSELGDPSTITQSKINEITVFNWSNMIVPLVAVVYILSFILFCFYIEFFSTIVIQSLLLIIVSLIGLYHYLRKHTLSMLRGLPMDMIRKLAVAGILARSESIEFLEQVLMKLDDSDNRKTWVLSRIKKESIATEKLTLWFEGRKDQKKHLGSYYTNAGILAFLCALFAIHVAISSYYFTYADT